jgi:hypothetical protein
MASYLISEMSMAKEKPKKGKATPGPKPEILKIEGNWKATVKKSLAKNKPKQGWPK